MTARASGTPRRILVTGGCGFIGSNFLRLWRRHHPQDELVNLDLLTYAGNPANVAEFASDARYRFVRGDVADPKAAESAMRGAQVVVHFAAESHVDRSIRDSMPFVHTNVEGTRNLLEAARRLGVERFHHVSTDEVFGELPLRGSEKFNEESPYRPRSPYAASKAAADHLVRAWGATYGLRFTLTHGGNNYGPYQHPEKVIPRFTTRLLALKTVPVYGKGANVRDWLHVEDYCTAIEAAIERGRDGSTYCVGGEGGMDNLRLARAIAKAFSKGDEAIEFVPDRPGHDLRYALDSRRIRKELGWAPRYTFEKGLAATLQWYRDHADWWEPLAAKSEKFYQ